MNLRQQFFWKVLIGLSMAIIIFSIYNSYSKYSEFLEYQTEYKKESEVTDNKNMERKTNFISDNQNKRINFKYINKLICVCRAFIFIDFFEMVFVHHYFIKTHKQQNSKIKHKYENQQKSK